MDTLDPDDDDTYIVCAYITYKYITYITCSIYMILIKYTTRMPRTPYIDTYHT